MVKLDELVGKLKRDGPRNNPRDALETLKNVRHSGTVKDDYIDYLTDALVSKYEDHASFSSEDGLVYRQAIVESIDVYKGLLKGAREVDSLDGILGFLVILEPFGVDIAKDVIELPFKGKHVLNHYVVQPLKRKEKPELGRAATLTAAEALSFVPYVGSFIDFLHMYTKMAEDTIITRAFNTVNPVREGYNLSYMAGNILGEPADWVSKKLSLR